MDASLELPSPLREAVAEHRAALEPLLARVTWAENSVPEGFRPSYAGFSTAELCQISYHAKQAGNTVRVQRIAQELAQRRTRQ